VANDKGSLFTITHSPFTKQKHMSIIKRMKEPTPKFFRIIRNIGIALASIGGTIVAAPIALPAAIITAAGYLAVAGTVATAVSQAVTVPSDEDLWKDEVK
jgi:hypothetical protein